MQDDQLVQINGGGGNALEVKASPTQSDSDASIHLSADNDREMLRLIQQYLTDHGFPQISHSLQLQSGVPMEDTPVQSLRHYITSGLFAEARLILKHHSGNSEIEYLLFEQEYMEKLERGERLEAILILQRELTPRCKQQVGRVYALSQLILCQNGEQLRKTANWGGSGESGRQQLLQKLQSLLPDMLPPQRLEVLVKQSIAYQTSQARCKYHNSLGGAGAQSLLEDHKCEKRVSVPSRCIAVLKKHRDEVWMVKWAPSGSRFATVGKDNVIFLWSLQRFISKSQPSLKTKYKVKCTHEILGHSQQINCINWSPDERFLLSASSDSKSKLWDTKSGRLLAEIDRHVQQVQSAAFLSESRILTSGVDKMLIMWECTQEGAVSEVSRVESRNYLDIAVSGGKRFVTAGQGHFQVFQGLELESSYEQEVSDTLLSIALSKDGKLLLANVSLKSPRLELYELTDKKALLLRRFKGAHEQSMYVLRCAFGGAHDAFALCGSEDGSIALWNRENPTAPLVKLQGHAQVVNCVQWCPTDALLFASASDDMTVRLWGGEGVSTCEVIEDSRELKRIDIVKQQVNGGKHSPIAVGVSNEDEEIEEDEEEDEASDDEYDEEGDDDQEMMEEYNNAHARERVLQTTRVLRSNRREDDDEEEDSRMEGAEDDEEEDDSDWVEGDQQQR